WASAPSIPPIAAAAVPIPTDVTICLRVIASLLAAYYTKTLRLSAFAAAGGTSRSWSPALASGGLGPLEAARHQAFRARGVGRVAEFDSDGHLLFLTRIFHREQSRLRAKWCRSSAMLP